MADRGVVNVIKVQITWEKKKIDEINKKVRWNKQKTFFINFWSISFT